MKYLISSLLLCIVAVSCMGQKYGDGKFKQKFNKADALVFDGAYLEALPLFEDLYVYDTTNANLNYLLGVCYLKGKKDHSLAIKRLESATKNVSLEYSEANWKERKAPGIAYYYLGKAYHFKNKFDRAVSNYYNYRSFIEMDDVATYNAVRLQIQYAENAMELIQNPVNVKITSLGAGINTKYPEYCPIISADGRVLIFTSRREDGTGKGTDDEGIFNEDIYVCQKQADGSWGTPKSIGTNINSSGHEAAIGLSPDGQLLFIYKDDNNDGNIYFSRKSGEDWTKPQQLGSDINTSSWETHASVNATQDLLIFVSNRKGGYGGRDLWYSKKLPDGNWGLAQNMGSVLNTQYEEDSPFITADGKTLIFSSQGHTSMGGFDIFRSEYLDGAWTPPENIGYPINTSEDDVFFVLAPDGRNAFYSSRKDGGLGETDIYKLRLDSRKSSSSAVARGIMQVPAMDYADISAQIVVSDEGGAQVGVYRPNSTSGYYVLILSPGETYTVSYQADGYEPIEKQVPIANEEIYAEYDGVVELEDVVFGEDILALQKEKERLDKEKEAAAAKTAEQEQLALAAAEKAKADAEQLSIDNAKEEERKQAEELAAKETADAGAALEEEKARTRAAEEERKKAEAKARFSAEKELAAKTAEEEVARKQAEEDALAKDAEAKKLEQELAIAKAKEKAVMQAEELAIAKATEMEAARKAAELAELQIEEKEVALAKQEEQKLAEQKRVEEQAQAKLKEEAAIREQAEIAAQAKAAEEEILRVQEEAKAKAAKEAQEQTELALVKEQEEQGMAAEKQAGEVGEAKAKEQQQIAKLAEANSKKQELQARIEALKVKQEGQERTVSDVKEVTVKKDNAAKDVAAVNAAEIKAKRETMLARIAELKKRKEEVGQQKVVDEAAVTKASQKEEEILSKKQKLVNESETKKVEIAELQKELTIVEAKVDEAEREIQLAKEEVVAAEEKVKEDIAEEKRIAQEEKKKQEEAQAAAQQIEELEEMEKKRLEEERLASEKIEQEQREEVEKTKRELEQLEALAEQQHQVEVALKIEEEKKRRIDVAEEDTYSQEHILNNAETLDQLRKLNRQLIQDNLDLKKQLAELNSKLDLILARLDYAPDLKKVELPMSSTMRNLQDGKRLVLRNIFFDYNKASLRPKSKYEMNKLYKFMKENPSVKIVVSGHTDSRGNDDYNLKLSRDRAQAVVNYLVRNGIEKHRLSAKGYGETRPIARNENSDMSDNPVGRQLNRRIEVSLPKGGGNDVEVEEITVPKNARID